MAVALRKLWKPFATSVGRLVSGAYDFLREELIPALEANHIRLLNLADLSLEQRAHLDTFFAEKVFPVLTPLAFDPGRPFPHISNLSLNIAVAVREPGGGRNISLASRFPTALPQLLPVAVPPGGNRRVARIRLRLAGAADHRQSAPPVSGPRNSAGARLPPHPRRRSRHQGTGDRRSARNHRRSGVAAPFSRRRAPAGGLAHAIVDDRIPGRQAGVGLRRTSIRVHGPLDLSRLRHLLASGSSRFEGQALSAIHSVRLRVEGRRYFRRDPAAGSIAASSLRILPAGGRIPAQGGAATRTCWRSR